MRQCTSSFHPIQLPPNLASTQPPCWGQGTAWKLVLVKVIEVFDFVLPWKGILLGAADQLVPISILRPQVDPMPELTLWQWQTGLHSKFSWLIFGNTPLADLPWTRLPLLEVLGLSGIVVTPHFKASFIPTVSTVVSCDKMLWHPLFIQLILIDYIRRVCLRVWASTIGELHCMVEERVLFWSLTAQSLDLGPWNWTMLANYIIFIWGPMSFCSYTIVLVTHNTHWID